MQSPAIPLKANDFPVFVRFLFPQLPSTVVREPGSAFGAFTGRDSRQGIRL